jgi:hypothetical protein
VDGMSADAGGNGGGVRWCTTGGWHGPWFTSRHRRCESRPIELLSAEGVSLVTVESAILVGEF